MANKSLFQDMEGVKSYMPASEDDNYINLTGTVSSYAIKTGYTPPATEITVEQWLRPDASSKTMSSFSYAHSSSDNSFLLYNVNNNITPHINNAIVTTGLTLPPGVFSHLAVTWRSSDGLLQVFINGIKRYETKNIAKSYKIPSGGALVIGQEQDSVGGSFAAAQAFLGGVGETRVWNKVLTEEEIQQMMYITPIGTEEGLVDCWSFSEGAGNKALDKIRAQDLTLVGAIWKTGGVSLKNNFEWKKLNDPSFNKDMFDDYGLQIMNLLDRKRKEIKFPAVKGEDNKFSSRIDLINILSIKVEQ